MEHKEDAFEELKSKNHTNLNKVHLTTEPEVTDIFSEFGELYEIDSSGNDVPVVSENILSRSDYQHTQNKEAIINYQELIDEAKAKKAAKETPKLNMKPEVLDVAVNYKRVTPTYNKTSTLPEEQATLKDEEMNLTKKIDSLTDEKLENLAALNNQQNDNFMEASDVKKNEPMSLEAAFVNCSILGFITMFMGFGMLFYILNNI